MNIFEIVVTIVGIVMSMAYFPQAYQIYKKKSSGNVSKLSYAIFAIGTTTWLIYGITLNSWVIMLSFIPGTIGSWLVLILMGIYNRRK